VRSGTASKNLFDFLRVQALDDVDDATWLVLKRRASFLAGFRVLDERGFHERGTFIDARHSSYFHRVHEMHIGELA
jgi:hypothetical protein